MANAVIVTRAGVRIANIFSSYFKNQTVVPSNCISHLWLISRAENHSPPLNCPLDSFPRRAINHSLPYELRNEITPPAHSEQEVFYLSSTNCIVTLLTDTQR